MKYTLNHENDQWSVTLEGTEDDVVDALKRYYGDHEEALDVFEASEKTGTPGECRITVTFTTNPGFRITAGWATNAFEQFVY